MTGDNRKTLDGPWPLAQGGPPRRLFQPVVFQDHPRHLTSHSHRVVGAPVFGVNLGRVGQVQVVYGCAVVGDAPAVVDADYGLGRVHFVVVVIQDPRPVEIGVDLLEVGNEILQQLLPALLIKLALWVGVVGEVDDVPASVQ